MAGSRAKALHSLMNNINFTHSNRHNNTLWRCYCFTIANENSSSRYQRS